MMAKYKVSYSGFVYVEADTAISIHTPHAGSDNLFRKTN